MLSRNMERLGNDEENNDPQRVRQNEEVDGMRNVGNSKLPSTRGWRSTTSGMSRAQKWCPQCICDRSTDYDHKKPNEKYRRIVEFSSETSIHDGEGAGFRFLRRKEV